MYSLATQQYYPLITPLSASVIVALSASVIAALSSHRKPSFFSPVILEGTPHRTCHIEDPQTALSQTKAKQGEYDCIESEKNIAFIPWILGSSLCSAQG
jgi:hypothetical protein